MKLHKLRIYNFLSFGPNPVDIDLNKMTFLIGTNGTGKTAVLLALCRLFSIDPSLRRIRKSDFHTLISDRNNRDEKTLWIEAEFIFPELSETEEDLLTIPPHFKHMRLDNLNSEPRVRYRLKATIEDDEIEEEFLCVLDVDSNDEPISTIKPSKAERSQIQVYYLPAMRDPVDQVSYSANALLGRVLKSIKWNDIHQDISNLTNQIGENLAKQASIELLSSKIKQVWQGLHRGDFFKNPKIAFISGEIDDLLKHVSLSFSPGHEDEYVDFSRLSDGHKSVLYLSLVLSTYYLGQEVLKDNNQGFIPERLKPAIFTIIVVEEPENSLSPNYLGRIISELHKIAEARHAQVLITTHSPSMLRRVLPDNIRYMRLNSSRETEVTRILMPKKSDEAHKFVREAVQAYPELYFSRLVVLGEGASEEIVLPRLLKARSIVADESFISIVPLGGRHVNHFWKLLNSLGIPFITLLDLDMGRYNGGWGRIRYITEQLMALNNGAIVTPWDIKTLPRWDSADHLELQIDAENDNSRYIHELEKNGIFFASPLDLDFVMLENFSKAFEMFDSDLTDPDDSGIKAILGKKYNINNQYTSGQKKLFGKYHQLFKIGSKPVAHISALANLTDDELNKNMPPSLSRFIASIETKLGELLE